MAHSNEDRFDIVCAQRRLAAVDQARQKLDEATQWLVGADVKNVRVAKAMAMVRKELTDYHHVTEYAIRKREDRIANYQPARAQRKKEAEGQEQGPSLERQPAEAWCLPAGLHHEAEEAEFGSSQDGPCAAE